MKKRIEEEVARIPGLSPERREFLIQMALLRAPKE
jgi:hypothetical protein